MTIRQRNEAEMKRGVLSGLMARISRHSSRGRYVVIFGLGLSLGTSGAYSLLQEPAREALHIPAAATRTADSDAASIDSKMVVPSPFNGDPHIGVYIPFNEPEAEQPSVRPEADVPDREGEMPNEE
jgi:hypothetical protein